MLDGFVSPEDAFRLFEEDREIIQSSARTGGPTQDRQSRLFFGMPYDDFLECSRTLLDENEKRAYLAIVAATEGLLLRDASARSQLKKTVLLSVEMKALHRTAQPRVGIDAVLDCWKDASSIQRRRIGEFRQLLLPRHWLAHGRHFDQVAHVQAVPGLAIQRSRALIAELQGLDSDFPRQRA